MFAESLEVIRAVWGIAVLGTGLMLIGTVGGWVIGQTATLPPVRLVTWWIRGVVMPLLRCRSWWRRAATIFANNLSILALLVAAGRWHTVALVAVSGLGVSLGVGLRILMCQPAVPWEGKPRTERSAKRRVRVGIALNLLEPPAIALAIGLSLGRSGIPLSATQMWETFLLWVIPFTLLAALGEALWMGEIPAAPSKHDSGPPHPSEPRCDP